MKRNLSKNSICPILINNNNKIDELQNIGNKLKDLDKTKIRKIRIKYVGKKCNKNNIIIAVRVRPLNKREKEESDYKTINIINKDTLTISIPTEYKFNEKGKKELKKENKMNIINEKQKTFKFDFVFDEIIKQNIIYKFISQNLIEQVLEGYNATIFAYGATGTGKTYTMLGSGCNIGIMIRTIRDLFSIINNNNDKKYIIKILYLEIYNEIIKDLLNKNNKVLELRNDPKKGVIIQGAEYITVSNDIEAFNLILKGNKNRTEKNTEYNETSSRSHAILEIIIEIEDQQVKLQPETKFGKFMLLDLAGSERASFFSNSKNSKGNIEVGSINKSLLALNKCISLLTLQNKYFIPWRESKLTRLLQNSLSGNSRIIMIATVSPALIEFDETLFTLQIANKVKNLKVNLKKNVFEDEIRINRYDEFIKDIKEEIVDVKKNIIEQDNSIINEIIISNNNTNNNFSINNNDNASNRFTNNNKDDINQNVNAKVENNDTKNNDINKIDESQNDFKKIIEDMMEHFQLEIKLKKIIFEKENIIEDLKNEVNQKEYELLHKGKINIQNLKNQLKEQREDINEKQKKLIKDYIKQNKLNSKRKEFQKIIIKLLNNAPNNPEFFKAYNIYKYNINLIENLAIEHKKHLNIQESKRKDKKIKGLMEQIELRDEYIRNAYHQFVKNRIVFDYDNPKLISSYQLDKIPVYPKIINITPSIPYRKSFSDTLYKNNDYTNENLSDMSSNILENESNISGDNYNIVRNEQIENLSLIKNKLLERKNSNTNIQYKSEILPRFQNHPLITKANEIFGLDTNNFQSKKNIIFSDNDKYYNPLNKLDLNSNSLKPIKLNLKKIHFNFQPSPIKIEKQRNWPLSDRNENKYILNNNLCRDNEDKDSSNNNTIQSKVSLTSNLENEIQKKVKTILNKNYIRRYRHSPYLRYLDE